MKIIFKVSSENQGKQRFGDCFYDTEDKAIRDLAERVSIFTRSPGFMLWDDSNDYKNDHHYVREYCGEQLFEVRIEEVLLQ